MKRSGVDGVLGRWCVRVVSSESRLLCRCISSSRLITLSSRVIAEFTVGGMNESNMTQHVYSWRDRSVGMMSRSRLNRVMSSTWWLQRPEHCVMTVARFVVMLLVGAHHAVLRLVMPTTCINMEALNTLNNDATTLKNKRARHTARQPCCVYRDTCRLRTRGRPRQSGPSRGCT